MKMIRRNRVGYAPYCRQPLKSGCLIMSDDKMERPFSIGKYANKFLGEKYKKL